jgi:hypothetical protein
MQDLFTPALPISSGVLPLDEGETSIVHFIVIFQRTLKNSITNILYQTVEIKAIIKYS